MLFNIRLETTTLNLRYSAIQAAEEVLLKASDPEVLLPKPPLTRMLRALLMQLRSNLMSKLSKTGQLQETSQRLSLRRMSRQLRRRSSTMRSTPSTTWRTLRVMIKTTAVLSTPRKLNLKYQLTIVLLAWAAESPVRATQPRHYWLVNLLSSLMRSVRRARDFKRSLRALSSLVSNSSHRRRNEKALQKGCHYNKLRVATTSSELTNIHQASNT